MICGLILATTGAICAGSKAILHKNNLEIARNTEFILYCIKNQTSDKSTRMIAVKKKIQFGDKSISKEANNAYKEANHIHKQACALIDKYEKAGKNSKFILDNKELIDELDNELEELNLKQYEN